MPGFLTPAGVRNLIEQVLPDDSALEAFVHDHFPQVKRQYGNGMDRTAKVTKLFELVGSDHAHAVLCQHFPQANETAEGHPVNGHSPPGRLLKDARAVHPCEASASAKGVVNYYLVLSGTIDEATLPLVKAMAAHLRKISGDAELTIETVKQGSIILHIRGTEEGRARLAQSFQSGELRELLGFPLEQVGEATPPERRDSAAKSAAAASAESPPTDASPRRTQTRPKLVWRGGSMSAKPASTPPKSPKEASPLRGQSTLEPRANADLAAASRDQLSAAGASLLLIEGPRNKEMLLQSGEVMYIGRQESGMSPSGNKPAIGPSGGIDGTSPKTSATTEGEDGAPDTLSERQFKTTSPYISQRHAVISLSKNGRFLVKDLDSANGTWLRLAPHQVYQLPENFELLLANNLVMQHRPPQCPPPEEVGHFASASDFAAYIRSQLAGYVSSVRVVKAENVDEQQDHQVVTRMPLLASGPKAHQEYLVVTWHESTIILTLERWLQGCVTRYNDSVTKTRPQRNERPWDFVAGSAERMHVLRFAQLYAKTNCAVLLCGPRGSGKEVLARELHMHSGRAKKPFISINCAALPVDLIEAELFGTKRAELPSAVERLGLFERAKEGTLFIDEVAELPVSVQAKLLRALDTKVIRFVGDTEDRPFKARIIAATNRDLAQMVTAGIFREDLYVRLNAVQLALPALQPSDVSALVPHLCHALHEDGFPKLPADTLLSLSQLAAGCAWAKNARLLRSVLERCLTLYDPAVSVSENWDRALQSCAAQLENSITKPQPVPIVGSSLPETLGQAGERLQTLLFLNAARQILVPYHRGSLKEMGHKMGMTGAGVAARLRRLEISTNPGPTAQQLDAKIAELQAELQPSLPLLRSILGL